MSKEEKFDKCVMCRTETEYRRTDHIDIRKYYMEGSGQFCADCYKSIYKEK